MERKVGEIFTYNGKTYQVVKADTCKDCAFSNIGCNSFQTLVAGTCIPEGRKDNINVAFREINNMENNQLTIDIPKGMEIDLENSDLTKGIVKFKKKDINYDNILQGIDSIKLRVSTYYIDKILAISQLMNIAKYYNRDWEPNWSDPSVYKYFIIYAGNTYKVDYNCTSIYNNIYFKNRKDAIAVINNPNFKDILDNIYKN